MEVKIKKYRYLKRILWIVLSILLLILLSFGFLRKLGKERLEKSAENDIKMESREKITAEEAEEGIVYYQGEKYRYNDEIFTILFMGIDTEDSFEEAGEDPEKIGSSKQSDSNFLVIVDRKAKTVQLLGISRDTMTDIKIYDEEGAYLRTVKEHLALQFAYGDGSSQSCELMQEAVSDLLYGMPIHGYCAINLDGIAVLNDAIGGVTLTPLQDITAGKVKLKEGQQVTLSGEAAHTYVRYRGESFASNQERIQRQKQYLSAFAKDLIEKTKKDLTIPLQLYGQMTEYMITDLSIDQMTYLVSELLDYQINLENIYTVQGEVTHPETSRYEQFHVDEDALYELILELFYEKVSE